MTTLFLIVNVPGSEGDIGTTPSDTTPDQFSFTDVTNASLSTLYTSNTVTLSGMDSDAAISIAGGQYSINGDAYTSSAGVASNGDTVSVRITSSGTPSTAASAILTVDGISDTFTVTTTASGGTTAGQPIGLLLVLTKAA